MEKTYNPALIQRTQRYMETHSISQNQFAAKVNLSSAALSSYLNQKYKGSVEAVERQLSEFFKLDEEAEAAAEKTASLLPRAAYVPTSISEDVCQSIRFAQLEHCMVVLHGDAGVGKSKGAQKFLRDHPTNAVGIYDLCRQTVTVYHACYNPFRVTRCVIHGAYFERKTVQTVDKSGGKSCDEFLLVIPNKNARRAAPALFNGIPGVYVLECGDRIVEGVGEEITTREQWGSFVPANRPGVVTVDWVRDMGCRNVLYHVEAGGKQ